MKGRATKAWRFFEMFKSHEQIALDAQQPVEVLADAVHRVIGP
jgi:hypothetical protein